MTMREYLEFISLLGQMHELAREIERDSREISCHKFVPHQLARLYKYCNRIHGDVRPFRRRIEEKFDEVQTQVDSGKCLSEGQVAWLRHLSAEIQSTLVAVPSSVREKVTPLVSGLIDAR